VSYFEEYLAGFGVFAALGGEPLSGKTSVVAQLLSSTDPLTGKPYELYVIDLDRNLAVMHNQWGSGKPRPAAELERIWPIYVGHRTKMDLITGAGKPADTKGWDKLCALTQRWREGARTAEPYEEWPSNRVLFVDGGTIMVQMAFQNLLGDRASGYWVKSGSDGRRLILRDKADYGGAATYIDDVVSSLFSIYPRRFHIFFSFHLMPLDIELSTKLDDDKIDAALDNTPEGRKAKKELEDAKRRGTLLVQTEREYPVVAGSKLSRKLFGKFPYVLAVDNDGEPRVLTASTQRFFARVPGQVGKLPAKMSGKDALTRILKHHSEMQAAAEPSSVTRPAEPDA